MVISYRNPSFCSRTFQGHFKGKSGFQGHPEINCSAISHNNAGQKHIWKYNVCLPVNTVSELKLFSLSPAPSLWVGLFYPFGLTISNYMYTFWALYDEAN